MPPPAPGRPPTGASRVLAGCVLAAVLCAGALAGALAITGAAAAPSPPPAPGEVIYSNMPADTAGLPVLLFESWSASEFGGEVSFAGAARKGATVSFLLASYACESGRAAGCRTTPGAVFRWPLTLEIYKTGPGASMGARVARLTRDFEIPYRPSASSTCPDEGWTRGFGAQCSFALMHKVSFSLPSTTLPSSAVVAIEFDTQNYGASPAGRSGPYNCAGRGRGRRLRLHQAQPAHGALRTGGLQEHQLRRTERRRQPAVRAGVHQHDLRTAGVRRSDRVLRRDRRLLEPRTARHRSPRHGRLSAGPVGPLPGLSGAAVGAGDVVETGATNTKPQAHT